MADTFQARIPSLSDRDLRQYLEHHLDYRTEAVQAALAELDRRRLDLPVDVRAAIQSSLRQRDEAAEAHLNRTFVTRLGASPVRRLLRLRQITVGILTTGLGAATAIYLLAAPLAPNPLGHEPQDTKKYLRDLELYGGKVNILATEFMRWWDGLWRGRNLAGTVAVLTLLLAALFAFLAHRQRLHAAAAQDESRASG